MYNLNRGVNAAAGVSLPVGLYADTDESGRFFLPFCWDPTTFPDQIAFNYTLGIIRREAISAYTERTEPAVPYQGRMVLAVSMRAAGNVGVVDWQSGASASSYVLSNAWQICREMNLPNVPPVAMYDSASVYALIGAQDPITI